MAKINISKMWESFLNSTFLNSNLSIIVAVVLAALSAALLHFGSTAKAKTSAERLESKMDSIIQKSVDQTIQEFKNQLGTVTSKIEESSGNSILAIKDATTKIVTDVGVATDELKSETEKLTIALNYSSLVIRMRFQVPEIQFKTGYEGSQIHLIVAEYILDTYEFELKMHNSERESARYQLSSEEFVFRTDGSDLRQNSVYASRSMAHGYKFDINLKFNIIGPPITNVKGFKNEGSFVLRFKEKRKAIEVEKEMRDYVVKEVKFEEGCDLIFINDNEWSNFELEGRTDLIGGFNSDFFGLLFNFNSRKSND